jgi:hypothetical protein
LDTDYSTEWELPGGKKVTDTAPDVQCFNELYQWVAPDGKVDEEMVENLLEQYRDGFTAQKGAERVVQKESDTYKLKFPWLKVDVLSKDSGWAQLRIQAEAERVGTKETGNITSSKQHETCRATFLLLADQIRGTRLVKGDETSEIRVPYYTGHTSP